MSPFRAWTGSVAAQDLHPVRRRPSDLPFGRPFRLRGASRQDPSHFLSAGASTTATPTISTSSCRHVRHHLARATALHPLHLPSLRLRYRHDLRVDTPRSSALDVAAAVAGHNSGLRPKCSSIGLLPSHADAGIQRRPHTKRPMSLCPGTPRPPAPPHLRQRKMSAHIAHATSGLHPRTPKHMTPPPKLRL